MFTVPAPYFSSNFLANSADFCSEDDNSKDVFSLSLFKFLNWYSI